MRNFNKPVPGEDQASSRLQSNLLITLSLVGIVGRLFPHPPNVTPVMGTAIWSGARLGRKKSLIILLTTMLVTDIFLGFHKTMPYVYMSMILTIVLTSRVKKYTTMSVTGLGITSELLFFLITNFGVWQTGSFYPKTIQGLLVAYANGLPFLRLSVMGTLVYVLLLFGLEALVMKVARKSGLTNVPLKSQLRGIGE